MDRNFQFQDFQNNKLIYANQSGKYFNDNKFKNNQNNLDNQTQSEYFQKKAKQVLQIFGNNKKSNEGFSSQSFKGNNSNSFIGNNSTNFIGNNYYSAKKSNNKSENNRINFKKQIRRNHVQSLRKSKRQQLLKTINNKQFLILLQKLSQQQNLSQKSLFNLLQDLKTNLREYQFSIEVDKNNKIKMFIIGLFRKNIKQITLKEKSMLLQSLIYLTYYGLQGLQLQIKKQLNQLIGGQINMLYRNLIQLQQNNINNYNLADNSNLVEMFHQKLQYLTQLIDLLMNFVANYSHQQNILIMNSILPNILKQLIILIDHQTIKFEKNLNLRQKQKTYIKILLQQNHIIKKSYLQFINNLTLLENITNDYFQFVINQIVCNQFNIQNDQILLIILKILKNFFNKQQFRKKLKYSSDFCGWYQGAIPTLVQKKFSIDLKYYQNKDLKEIQMNKQQIDLFSGFLNHLICFIQNNQNQNQIDQTKILIQQNLNAFCLSQFLIANASLQYRNSHNILKAFKIYEYLASDPYVAREELLIVVPGRHQEDILKIFLTPGYFTNLKTSQIVLSFLNKLLSKDYHLLQKFMQLRIFQCIIKWFQGSSYQQTRQIINLFELLMIMIASEDDLERDQNNGNLITNGNRILRLIDQEGLLKTIQRYQDHQQQEVVAKVQMFLKFYQAKDDCRQDCIEI